MPITVLGIPDNYPKISSLAFDNGTFQKIEPGIFYKGTLIADNGYRERQKDCGYARYDINLPHVGEIAVALDPSARSFSEKKSNLETDHYMELGEPILLSINKKSKGIIAGHSIFGNKEVEAIIYASYDRVKKIYEEGEMFSTEDKIIAINIGTFHIIDKDVLDTSLLSDRMKSKEKRYILEIQTGNLVR